MNIVIPNDVNKIIETLYENGYEAYAVGGCVRDSFLGKEPKDWDITTSASPLEVKSLFKRTIDTGIKHGTVTVLLNHVGYEVTTYRIDGEYADNRHPQQVVFTSNLVEDLKRRDFTINAMAYNERVGLVDCFNGADDLNNGVIRCVGEAIERFDEDALRILRAIRFSAQLGFDIEDRTIKAIIKRAENLKNISAERIKVELDKILNSDNPDRLIRAYEYGIMDVIMPEFGIMMKTRQENPNHIYSVGEHTIKAVMNINDILKMHTELGDLEKLMLRWTMLLHDIAKPMVKKYDEEGIAHFKCHEVEGAKIARVIFERLKFDRYTMDNAINIIRWHDYRFNNTRRCIRHAVSNIGNDIMPYIFIVKEADVRAQNPAGIDEKLLDINETKEIFASINEENECMSIKDLAIDGKNLLDAGVCQGVLVGQILRDILDIVLDNPELNKEDILMNIVKERYLNK